jgi:hypothetical protein
MRINVYSQELELFDRPTELITQLAGTGRTYSGVRIYLKSAAALHDTPDDDDRSAITFWLPRSETNRAHLAGVLEDLSRLVRSASPQTGMD